MSAHNADRLAVLDACEHGVGRASKFATLRGWWEKGGHRADMMWLVGRAHSHGPMTRRRLVAVTLRFVETGMHLMPDDSIADLGLLAQWCAGRDDVDLAAILERRLAAYAAAATAAAAAANAAKDADANAYAAAANVYAAATAAANAVGNAADVPCDVIRDAITIDELCSALGLRADEGVSR